MSYAINRNYFDIVLDSHLYMSVNNQDYYNSFEDERLEVVQLLEQYNDKILERKDMIALAKCISTINGNKNINLTKKDQFKDLLEYYFIPFEWKQYEVNNQQRWGIVIRLNAFQNIYELILKLRDKHCSYYLECYNKLTTQQPLSYEEFKSHVLKETDLYRMFRTTTNNMCRYVDYSRMRYRFTYLKK